MEYWKPQSKPDSKQNNEGLQIIQIYKEILFLQNKFWLTLLLFLGDLAPETGQEHLDENRTIPHGLSCHLLCYQCCL